MLTDHDKATGTREPVYKNFSDAMYKKDPTQGIPDWLHPFTLISRNRCDNNNGSTVFTLISANTERDLFYEQKD